ncbi:MAG: hypothetical protein EON58_15230, partial [Alphaproteobacteria bacterium]
MLWLRSSEDWWGLQMPDLDVQNAGDSYPPTLSASSVVAGGSVTLTYRLSNWGPGVAPSSTTGIYRSGDATISTGDSRIGTDSNSSLNANAGRTETVTIDTTGWAPGTYYIGAVADYSNAISEANESNNASSGVRLTVTDGHGASGFRDPLGNGTITANSSDRDGYFANRTFMKVDTDDGDTAGKRHLGVDWNANSDADEIAHAAYGGTVAYASADAGHGRGGVVMLNHTTPDGAKYTTVYMHLEHIPQAILNGTLKSVEVGFVLGDSGFVKKGQGLHVHFEVRAGHQSGQAALGFGYVGGETGAVVEGAGVTNGVHYADIRLSTGISVRYLDPIEFVAHNRAITHSMTEVNLLSTSSSPEHDSLETVSIDSELQRSNSTELNSVHRAVYLDGVYQSGRPDGLVDNSNCHVFFDH